MIQDLPLNQPIYVSFFRNMDRLMRMYVDTHLHLDEPWKKPQDAMTEEKRQKAIKDINDNQIVTFVMSVDISTYENVIEYCKQSKYLFPAFGILPWYAHEYKDRLDEVAKLCDEALMFGEIGLDEKYARDKACIPYQQPLFDVFCKAAEKHDLILNLHFRDKEEEFVDILSSYDVRKPILHSYSGSLKLMNKVNDLGYYYSTGYRYESRSKTVVEVLNNIPSDKLLLEIDTLHDGIPSIVYARILDTIAEIRNTTPEEIEALNQKNVLALIDNHPRLVEITKLLNK